MGRWVPDLPVPQLHSMDEGKEQNQSWEDGFLKARDFLAGFKLKSAVVEADKRMFYASLTGLLASLMERDKQYVSTLPPERKRNLKTVLI